MIPGVTVNLSIYLGEDKSITDTIFQTDGVTPQNITGWNVTFTVHAYGDPTDVLVTKTVAGGGIVLTNPTGGVMTITILNADTVNMFPGQYEFTIERTDSGADTVPTRGLFTVLRK